MQQLSPPTEDHTAVIVRVARAADFTQTARVWRTGWLDGHRDHVSADLLAARGPEYFTDRAAAWTESTLLATQASGNIVGVVIVIADELVQLAVDPRARRQGVGAALLHAAEARVADAHEQAWLAVVAGNTRARAFYEHHGWRDTGELVYQAPSAAGPVPVPVRRYVKPVAASGGTET